MLSIRPVSDLRNKFSEIEDAVHKGGPVCLTKNGYDTMVVLSMEDYSKLTNPVELALDQADYVAETNPTRMTHEEVFSRVRR